MNNAERVKSAVRLVATDLDGTLLRDDRTLSPRTRQTLARVVEAGVTIALVTARPPRFVAALASEVGLSGPAICCNGAITYDVTHNVLLEHCPLAAIDAVALVQALRIAVPGVSFAVERGLVYGCEPAYLTLGALTQPQDGLLADALALCAEPVTKLIARHPVHQAEDLFPIAQGLASERALVTFSSPRFIEISATGVDKAAALARLCQRLGVATCEVVAFGDMPNDAPMLRWAGCGVAVANAHDKALAAADAITASNMDDGVALFLERLLDL
ncbi:MAG TPA: Cof-type HAD-IIB family hydrolase [Ktedonobacterales bacterium]|nr:Cof-type HAD-IIB family hydrolase [Ktedonobacterales bacterium]